MIEKHNKRKLSFHKFFETEKPPTLKEYKSIQLYKKLLIFSIVSIIIFWIFIVIALATPNYDIVSNKGLYVNMSIKYNVYIAIFFFSALLIWGINVIMFIFLALYIYKLQHQILKELLWLSAINVFFSIALIFSIITFVNINIFLKNNSNIKKEL